MKNLIIYSTLMVLGLSNVKSQAIKKFNGTWRSIINGKESSFSLFINQKGPNISGSHCSVMLSGGAIDCCTDDDEVSIKGVVSSNVNTVTLTFTSAYCNCTGQATITLLNNNTIKWSITKEPGEAYFIPMQATLTKQVENTDQTTPPANGGIKTPSAPK